MTILRFTTRPSASLCVSCPNEVPDAQVSLETVDGYTVCDQCAQQIDPGKARALEVLRRIDQAWWETAQHGQPLSNESVSAANEYLRSVLAGVQMLAEFYCATAVEEAQR